MAFLARIESLLVRSLTRTNPAVYRRLVQQLPSRTFVHQLPTYQPEGRITCTMIPGDGVGPELMHSVVEVFRAASVPLDFEIFSLSEVNPASSATLEEVCKSIQRNRICLKGTVLTPGYGPTGELQTLNMKFTRKLDLYASVVVAKTQPGIQTRHQNVDMLIVREHIEGEYSALEHESVKGVVESLKIVTRYNSKRIAKFAFDYAAAHNRKRVVAVHKANIMKLGDGLFLQCCSEIAQSYSEIEYATMIVDNCSMQIVLNPRQFDVLVTMNLYGKIIGNIAAGIVGGAGVVAGERYSDDCVVFEPGAQHTFLEASGKNVANPTAMLLCSAQLLCYVNLHEQSDMIKNAVDKVLKEGKVKTKDMGGEATTSEFTNAIINNLASN